MAKKILTQEYIQSLFDYKEGELYWKVPRFGARKNIPAGSTNKRNYRVVVIDYKQQQLHRMIFLYHYGYLPKLIDHIDNNPKNNNINNLRAANYYQNCQNSKMHKTNTSGFKNVFFCKILKKWRVRVSVNGKRISFGHYDDIELADLVAQEARDKYHKEFVNHSN